MSVTPTERRALQAVVAIACLVPLTIGGISIVRGPGWLDHAPAIPTDLDSQFRYVSGIFFALGLAFTTCVRGIERKGARFRLLGLLVVAGGLARLYPGRRSVPPPRASAGAGDGTGSRAASYALAGPHRARSLTVGSFALHFSNQAPS
ncbi:hypothetical protein GCM10020258_07790 [Sphingomonas yabuuchiae]